MKRKLFYIIAFALGASLVTDFALAQPNSNSGKSRWSIRSFDMGLTNRGISVGGTWRHHWNRVQSTPLQFNLLFYRDSDKIPVYDYYSGQSIDTQTKKVMFLNMRTGYQHRVWADAIAANVRPYLLVTGGPALAINPANVGGFFERWGKTTLSYTANLFAGGGVDFVYSRSSQFSVTLGYEIMYFPAQVDGVQNYSGVVVMLSFGERL